MDSYAPPPTPIPITFQPHSLMKRMDQIDPKDYPFHHHIEANKHLDTDKLRHKIESITECIDTHYQGKEHLYCDKEQLRDGKFRKPKVLVEAEQAGHANAMDHYEAKQKKATEEVEAIRRKERDDDDQHKKHTSELLEDLQKNLVDTIATIKTYQAKTDERFDKLLNLILSKK